MKTILLIIFLFFSSQVHADWASFLSGALQAMNENAEKKGAVRKVKGSAEDYNALKEFAGCTQYVESQKKYDSLNEKSPFPQHISYTHISDNSFANNKEKNLIISFLEEIEICIERINPNSIDNTSLRSLLLQSQIIWSQTIMDFINVFNETMTWGVLNRNIQQRANFSEQYFTQWEKTSDEVLASKYKEINNYWNNYDKQRKAERRAIVDSYLNSFQCRRENVYDENGNYKSVRICN